jgi:predicted DNA-binding transcriptional regulator AlpA
VSLAISVVSPDAEPPEGGFVGGLFFAERVPMTTTAKTLLIGIGPLSSLLGVSRETIRAWAKRRRFPEPLPIGNGKMWWSMADVEDALAGRWQPAAADENDVARQRLPGE